MKKLYIIQLEEIRVLFEAGRMHWNVYFFKSIVLINLITK